jgi:hypothetical protein
MLPARSIGRAVLLVSAATLLAACGSSSDHGSSGDDRSSTSSSASNAPTPGSEYEGKVSDGSNVRVVIDDDGAARVKLGYKLNCGGRVHPQSVDLGPFRIEDREIRFPSSGGLGTLTVAGSFGDHKVSGTIVLGEYNDSKLGDCDSLDLTWKARQSRIGAVPTGPDDTFEPGEELVTSDFSKDADGWELANTKQSHPLVEDGSLRLYLRIGGAAGVAATDTHVDRLLDVVVTTSATLHGGTDPADSFGVSCRRNGIRGYDFYVGRDGRAGIFGSTGPGPLETIGTGALDEPIQNGTTVQLTAACVRGRLQLIVDGKLVIDATDDDPLPAGTVSLLAAGRTGTDVVFDDAVIAGPKR